MFFNQDGEAILEHHPCQVIVIPPGLEFFEVLWRPRYLLSRSSLWTDQEGRWQSQKGEKKENPIHIRIVANASAARQFAGLGFSLPWDILLQLIREGFSDEYQGDS